MEIAPGYTHEQCLEDAVNFVSFIRGELGQEKKTGPELRDYVRGAIISSLITDSHYHRLSMSFLEKFQELFPNSGLSLLDFDYYPVHPENGVSTDEPGQYLYTPEGTLYLVARD